MPQTTATEDLRAAVRAQLAALDAEQIVCETGQAPIVPAAEKMIAGPTTAARDDDDRPRPSQATRIVDLALAERIELWHTPTDEPHITISTAGHREHHALVSRAVRDWLARLHHTHTQRTPGSQAIADALVTLGGMARYDGAAHTVHVRIAKHANAVYLDLGDASWGAVEVTVDGWRLVTDPPVRFRRGRALLALPAPEPGGSLDALRDVIHTEDDDDWRLLAGWLVGALRPTGPYPLLALDGEQGSGKSTTARLLRRVIDPSAAELRAEPREIRDLMIAASSGWVVALDNVSHLQPWLSDALCRISTGGAMSTRQLYTDGDEHIIEAIRPCLVTGVTSVVSRGDLADRTLAVTLPTIPDHARRPEADLWTAYEAMRPRVLGALLDAVAGALRRQHDVRLVSLPRMADWAVWVTAAEPALGWRTGALVEAYTRTRQQAVETTLDGDPLAVAIRALARPYEGTAAELLTRLTPTTRIPRGWPESPRGLSAALRRLAPQLRRIGIDVVLDRRQGHDRRRVIAIEAAPGPAPTSPERRPHVQAGAQPSASSAPSISPDLLAGCADANADGSRVADFASAFAAAQNLNEYGPQTDADDADAKIPPSSQDAPEADDDAYY